MASSFVLLVLCDYIRRWLGGSPAEHRRGARRGANSALIIFDSGHLHYLVYDGSMMNGVLSFRVITENHNPRMADHLQ
jgi:hypothetical protein